MVLRGVILFFVFIGAVQQSFAQSEGAPVIEVSLSPYKVPGILGTVNRDGASLCSSLRDKLESALENKDRDEIRNLATLISRFEQKLREYCSAMDTVEEIPYHDENGAYCLARIETKFTPTARVGAPASTDPSDVADVIAKYCEAVVSSVSASGGRATITLVDHPLPVCTGRRTVEEFCVEDPYQYLYTDDTVAD